jgi:hypothetical protein
MSTYTPIATQTLGSAAASVIFSSIPQGYTDLIIVFNGNLSAAATCYLRYNNDSSGNYSQRDMVGNGTVASGQARSNVTGFRLYDVFASSNGRNNLIFSINSYSNTSTRKTTLLRGSDYSGEVGASVSLWRDTSAINRLDFVTGSGTWSSGSTFTLYGIQVGNLSAKAEGGSSVTTDGTYWYHTFNSSGYFIPKQALTVDYLVVAGGGGADQTGGGGGAGGLRSTVGNTGGGGSLESPIAVTAIPYPITVGAGGTSATAFPTNGNDSTFHTITSIGGGRGINNSNSTGNNGGSGGGNGGGNFGSGGTGTPNQGYGGGSGGAGYPLDNGGGGGGAGAVGANGSSGNGGAGGAGVSVSALATATGTGVSGFYAGGGGGWRRNDGTGPSGGSGGGGRGASGNVVNTAPIANTGSGAGANGGNNTIPGASGIVIIRYAV